MIPEFIVGDGKLWPSSGWIFSNYYSPSSVNALSFTVSNVPLPEHLLCCAHHRH